MTITRQYFHALVPDTTISAGIDATQTSITITSATGWPSTFPFQATIERGESTEETVLVTNRVTTTLTVTRNWDAGIGVATGTGQAHDSLSSISANMTSAIWRNTVGRILSASQAGDIIYYDGSDLQILSRDTTGTAERFLKSGTTPSWDVMNFPIYTSTGNRTTDIASPAAGDISYLNDGAVTEGPEYYHGSAWAKPWNSAWGIAQKLTDVTSDQATISTEVDITGAAYNFTAVANRYYRFVASVGNTTKAVANGGGALYLTDAANAHKKETVYGFSSTSDQSPLFSSFVTTLSAGSNTWKWRSSAVNSMTLKASATMPMQFWVEDIGPAGAPP